MTACGSDTSGNNGAAAQLRQITRVLDTLRDTHPDMADMFLHGRCYSLFLLLRLFWPQAQAYYSKLEGHVYVAIDGAIFDIRGRHLAPPLDLDLLDHRNGDRPHRWGKRDHRRLSDRQRREEEAEREAGERIWQAVEQIGERREARSKAIAAAVLDIVTPPEEGTFDIDDLL